MSAAKTTRAAKTKAEAASAQTEVAMARKARVEEIEIVMVREAAAEATVTAMVREAQVEVTEIATVKEVRVEAIVTADLAGAMNSVHVHRFAKPMNAHLVPCQQARLQDASEPEAEPFDHGGISGKSQIDPAQLRRQREEESKVYGENACQALYQSRPEAIVRAYFVQSVTPRFRDALRWMAANRKAYHVVDEQELAKVSGTEHHGGVCFLIKKRPGLSVANYLQNAPANDCVMALDNVGNPHNLGGMVRSCAFFGVKGVLLRDPGQLESGAAVRTAEGGAERLTAIGCDDFSQALDEFQRAGYSVVVVGKGEGERALLSSLSFPAKTVLVLSEERDGRSSLAAKQSDLSVEIDGAGQLESLNVSVTAGVLLAAWWRQFGSK